MKRTKVAIVALAFVAAGCASPDARVGEGSSTSAGPSLGTPIPGGGLSIGEAMASDLAGPLMVKGYVVTQGADLRLCSSIVESAPTACGKPYLLVHGLDLTTVAGLEAHDVDGQSVSWSSELVSILGAVEDGVISVSPTSN